MLNRLIMLKIKNMWEKSSFVSQKILSEIVFAIHKIKPVLTLNEPIYVVFIILDLRKLLIYEFNYKYVRTR